MPYDEEFFQQYREYLKEVNDTHIDLLGLLLKKIILRYPNNIIDLGAGIDGEFKLLYENFFNTPEPEDCFKYYKIDANAQDQGVIKLNYRDHDAVTSLVRALKCDCFVSLFSSESTSYYNDNYDLYINLFQNTNITFGIVSGFYYGDKLNQNPVETGGITFYQTLERMSEVKNAIFDEIRVEACVPSKMFGDNVFEVWKLFVRNQ